MRIETTTRELYQFNELSESAKEKARDWYRFCLDSHDYDGVIEDSIEIAALMGIEIENIYWRGFSSQGDGACFEGYYAYKKGSVKAVKDFAPLDKKLHEIVESLQAVQKRNFYKLEAKVKQRGFYNHPGCTDIDVTKETTYGTGWPSNDDMDEVVSLLRSFMNWIYRQLDKQNDYLNSNEYLDDVIEANEYEFTKDGRRA